MSKHITLQPGDILFNEGDAGDTMFVVTNGLIEITKILGGTKQVLAKLGPGEFVGELSILNHEPRSATGTALKETTLMTYDGATFENLLETHPHIALRIIHRLAKRLRETTERLEKIAHDLHEA